jgi:cytochrome c biogenesis protein CcmG, thiol:disulfide interchange protein DsbE
MTDRMRTRVLVSVLVLSFLVSAFIGPSVGPACAALRAGDALPKVTLYSLSGSKVTLPDDVRGKVVVIHFWASWCPYCVKEIAAIESIYKKYGDKDLAPFSINVGESRDAINRYIANTSVTYTILLDPDKQASKQYWITGVPMTFVADKNGVLRYKIFGEITGAGLKKIVSAILGR